METSSSDYPRFKTALAIVSGSFLGAGGLFFGFVLATLVVGLTVLVTGSMVSQFVFLVISLTFVQGVGCIGVALAYYKVRPVIAPKIREGLGVSNDGSPFAIRATLPNLRDVLVVVVGYVSAFGVVIAGSILITVAQSISGSQVNTGSNQVAEIGRQNPEILLLLIPASILLIGPGEELLFRGVVQGRIRERLSPVPGIVLPSAIFGGLHYFALTGGSLTGNLVALVLLTCVALVLGIAYEYTGNIVVPALIHGFYNATLFTLLYVSLVYADELQQQAALLGL